MAETGHGLVEGRVCKGGLCECMGGRGRRGKEDRGRGRVGLREVVEKNFKNGINRSSVKLC